MNMSDKEERALEELEREARQVPDDLGDLERGPDAFRERLRQAAESKQQVTIRLDVDIVAAFKDLAGPDGSYQTLINRALREWLDAGSVRGLVEDTLVSLIIGMRDEGISEEALTDIVMRMRERNDAHG
jgi:uncharacterized protein (DUF4415 family)